MMIVLSDNGGRRMEGDRRQLVDVDYSPDRRSGLDRRESADRRQLTTSKASESERRVIYELLSA